MFEKPVPENIRNHLLERDPQLIHTSASKYLTKNGRCLCCDLENDIPDNLANNPPSSSISNPVVSQSGLEDAMFHEVMIPMYRLGLLTNIDLTNMLFPAYKRNLPNNLLIQFINSISLEPDAPSILNFDVQTISQVLNSMAYSTQFINEWINKLCTDPCAYKSPESAHFFNILIFARGYLHRTNQPTDACHKRIEELKSLFLPSKQFLISFQYDPFIDQFVIGLRRNGSDLTDALFLNCLYLTLGNTKYFFKHGKRDTNLNRNVLLQEFHHRLLSSLKLVSFPFVFDFLRHTFTFSTILYSCIKEDELYRTILSFYDKNASLNMLLSLFEILIPKIRNPQIHLVFSEQYQHRTSKILSKKQNQATYWQIRFGLLNSFQAWLSFFALNINNGIAVKTGLNLIKQIYDQVKGQDKPALEILTVILSIPECATIQQLCSIQTELCHMMIRIFKNLKDLTSTQFNEFVNQNWKRLSKIILAFQRLEIAESSLKKKCSKMGLSRTSKMVVELIGVIRNIEERADIRKNKLKQRGFRLEEDEV